MKIFNFLNIIICIGVFVISCERINNNSQNILDFGEVNPGSKSEKTLTIKFNQEAKRDKNAFLEFKFCDSKGNPIDDISFSIGNRNLSKGRFKITPADVDPNNKVRIEIEFTSKAKEGEYSGFLMIVDASEKLKANITQMHTKKSLNVNEKLGEFRANYQVPMPPSQKYLIYAIVLLLTFFLLWILVLRNRIFPPMSGRINSSEGEIKLIGFKQFYVYGDKIPKQAKQTFFSKLLTGKIGHFKANALGSDENNYILITTQSTNKGIRNKFILSNSTNLTITKGLNILYDTHEYEIFNNNLNTKFIFNYSNQKHPFTT